MLEAVRQSVAARVDVHVLTVQADLEALSFAPSVDVVFSAAAFHWVLGHDRLFRELHAVLRPGGRLVAQCGGGPNIERILSRADRILATEPYRPYLEGWTGPWFFADAESTAARLASAGFVDIQTSLVEAPTVLPDRDEYTRFLEAVVLRAHCDRLPDASMRRNFLARLGEAGTVDDPPFSLDYWRLNLRARRPLDQTGDA
jgi:trans-aconitate 2-methyltransferase